MSLIRQDDIARFRDEQAKRVSRSTANVLLKIVRILPAFLTLLSGVRRRRILSSMTPTIISSPHEQVSGCPHGNKNRPNKGAALNLSHLRQTPKSEPASTQSAIAIMFGSAYAQADAE